MSDLYRVYKNAIDDNTIAEIMKLSKNQWHKATVLSNGLDVSKRKTDIVWCNEQWLYDLFWDYMENANQKSKWNLDIDCAEDFQLGRYETGGHYDFHIDSNGFRQIDMPNNKLLNGKTRKLSMVLWLNEDFKGGEFQFYDKEKIQPTKGTLMFFPSWMMHKVHKVTHGTRYSLVTWFCGVPLK